MKTEIDEHKESYQDWGLDNLVYRDGLLTLTLVTYDDDKDPIRFQIIFTSAVLFKVYDESSHFQDFYQFRDDGIVGSYENSSFLEYAINQTNVMSLNHNKLCHWSVMTTNEFVHVLSSEEPRIYNVT
jgi:hypothetical protein